MLADLSTLITTRTDEESPLAAMYAGFERIRDRMIVNRRLLEPAIQQRFGQGVDNFRKILIDERDNDERVSDEKNWRLNQCLSIADQDPRFPVAAEYRIECFRGVEDRKVAAGKLQMLLRSLAEAWDGNGTRTINEPPIRLPEYEGWPIREATIDFFPANEFRFATPYHWCHEANGDSRMSELPAASLDVHHLNVPLRGYLERIVRISGAMDFLTRKLAEHDLELWIIPYIRPTGETLETDLRLLAVKGGTTGLYERKQELNADEYRKKMRNIGTTRLIDEPLMRR